MIRRMVIRPDKVMVTADGEEEVLVVSRDAMREAFLDLESQMAISGGVAAISVQRVPTGIDGEMWTTAAILEWKDAPVARPKPEPIGHWEEIVEEVAAEAAAPAPRRAPAEPSPPEPAPAPRADLPFDTDDEADLGDPPAAVVYDPETGEPDEDLSAIPEDKRALAR